MAKKKYVYENKEALYAKLIFDDLTLADVFEVMFQRGYQKPCSVLVRLEDGEEHQKHFRVVGDELHIFYNRDHPAIPKKRNEKGELEEDWPQPTLWFKLSEKVRVRGTDIEIKPLKGTSKTKAFLSFSAGYGKIISVLERTRPHDS